MSLLAEQVAETSGFFTEVEADDGVARRAGIALVEQQIKATVDGVEAVAEFAGNRDAEFDILVNEVLAGALKAFLDVVFRDEQAARDLGIAETAKGLEGDRDLVLAREGGMTARENESELAIGDLGVEEEVVIFR